MSLDIVLWGNLAFFILMVWLHHNELVKALSGVACVIIGFTLLIGMLERHAMFPSFEQDYIATQQTMEDSRQADDDYIDHYSFRNEIVEINQKLQRYKYFNDTPWGAFIPDRVDDMKRIK